MMKAHPYEPVKLAAALASKDLNEVDILKDMREHPDLYFADHEAISEEHGVLPLSERLWRRACLAA